MRILHPCIHYPGSNPGKNPVSLLCTSWYTHCTVHTCTYMYVHVTLFDLHSYRLKQELDALVKDECQSYHKVLGTFTFKFHEPPTHPNCVAWLGGKYM